MGSGLPSVLLLAVVSCQTSPASDFARQLKAQGKATAVRIDRDGTVHARDPQGGEVWFTLEDQQKRRFHSRQGGVVKLTIMDPLGAPSALPTGVTEMMVNRGGVQHGPSWLSPYPPAAIEPEFAALTRDRVRGSWTFETADDTSAVRMFYAEQIAASGLTMRRGVAPQPARDLPVVIDAGARGGDRFVQIRMGPGPRTGAHGEVFYEYAR